MYLSKLKLHGFKSFAHATTLEFAPGITAIVGPNGCGKSNIVDAVRWAIGEQRPTALRSETMANVIFNGTAERRPLGMAEVELTIENNRGVLPTEYTEVEIGRRLFRDGTSEYLMNQSTCRLKDITSLFMDTGMGADAYSVIELKMIDEIISESIEDRRRLFEEAAGITRYKKRRRQALRKLEGTQADLQRLRDLVGEVEGKVDRLERQAEKAEKHRTLSERLRGLERALAEAEYTRLVERKEVLSSEQAAHEDQAQTLTTKQDEAEKQLAAARRTLAEKEQTLAEQREALDEKRSAASRLESDQRLQHERLQQARRDLERLERADREDEERRADLEQMRERLETDLEEAEPARTQAEEALEEARRQRDAARARAKEKREALQQLRQREEALRETHQERRSRLDRLASRIETLETERRRTLGQIERLETDADALDARAREAEAAYQEAQQAVEEARADLKNAEAEQKERRAALGDATDALQHLQRRCEALDAEIQLLESLVSSYDDFSDAVQFLAEEGLTDGAAAGELRTVADVLACDDQVRLALSAALGETASCIVVETSAAGRAAMGRLRQADRGQATFAVLSRLPERSPAAPSVDAEEARPLRPMVRTTAPAFDTLADALLWNVYLADSLDEAEALAERAEAPVRAVTAEGEWAGGPGLVRGGAQKASASPAAHRMGRREQLEANRRELRRLQQEIEDQQAQVHERREALKAVPVDEHRQRLETAEKKRSDAEQARSQTRYERQTLTDRKAEGSERLEELKADLEVGRSEADELRDQVDRAQDERAALHQRREEAAQAFEAAEARGRAAQDRFSEAHVTAVETQNRRENLQHDLERTHRRLDELNESATRREEEHTRLHETIETAETRQETLKDKIHEAQTDRTATEDRLREMRRAVRDTKEAIADDERRLRGLRQEREQAMRGENQQAVRLAEIKTRIEDLVQSVREDFDLSLPDQAQPPAEDFDEEATRKEVTKLRRTLGRLGDVNPLALQEYDEEKERLDFLTEQRADLEEAEETLLETINEINQTAADRFNETFSEIQNSFATIFERLFGEGATARLQLDEDDDPLESDIEIMAQPRGKRPSIIAQLSGGEKALTAIALLFAIYLVKPSPFCILDEVDAPLDDANTGRFMNLIRDFATDTQFILVTHNKQTMALADRMYGVTMQEQGISTLVGVELEEAMEMAE